MLCDVCSSDSASTSSHILQLIISDVTNLNIKDILAVSMYITFYAQKRIDNLIHYLESKQLKTSLQIQEITIYDSNTFLMATHSFNDNGK